MERLLVARTEDDEGREVMMVMRKAAGNDEERSQRTDKARLHVSTNKTVSDWSNKMDPTQHANVTLDSCGSLYDADSRASQLQSQAALT